MTDSERVNLLELDRSALAELLRGWGEPAYRAGQVWAWVYRELATDFGEMTNLPAGLRRTLAQRATLAAVKPLDEIASADGETRKVLLELADGETVESVLMLYARRRTACISTQVGCPIRCPFCATGQAGLIRNLRAGEIVAQALHLARLVRPLAPAGEHPLTNIVYMGMGEPLLNYEATRRSVAILNDSAGFGLGARQFTISTAGVAPAIRRLAGEALQVNLAVSLHAPDDALRDQLVPLNRRYPINELLDAVTFYIEATGRRVTFEYALIAGANDALEQAEALAARLAGMLAHVNLIPVNPAEGSSLTPTPRAQVDAFAEVLRRRGIACTVRLRRGIDVQAGCGQLRSRRRRSFDAAAPPVV
jgi:23S rRNA (adenine2503-C2)-methyltransferase